MACSSSVSTCGVRASGRSKGVRHGPSIMYARPRAPEPAHIARNHPELFDVRRAPPARAHWASEKNRRRRDAPRPREPHGRQSSSLVSPAPHRARQRRSSQREARMPRPERGSMRRLIAESAEAVRRPLRTRAEDAVRGCGGCAERWGTTLPWRPPPRRGGHGGRRSPCAARGGSRATMRVRRCNFRIHRCSGSRSSPQRDQKGTTYA